VFGIDRTPNTGENGTMQDTEALVIDAFAQLGLTAVPAESTGTIRDDLVIEPGKVDVSLELKRRSLVDSASASRLIASIPKMDRGPHDDTGPRTMFAVADRITAEARRVLTENGWGYLDLRGRLDVRAPGLVVSADVAPVAPKASKRRPLAGQVGLEVAAELLMNPSRPASVRELARSLKRSPSAVSDTLAAMRGENLIENHERVAMSELFWTMAEQWPSDGEFLLDVPSPVHGESRDPLRLGLDDIETSPGWALGGLSAAVALGAPVAVRADQVLDFFVPDASILRRARTLLGSAPSEVTATCSVRLAPVPAVCSKRFHLRVGRDLWPTAHPLFVALDLAKHEGRGRDVLEAWTPAGGVTRVW